MRKANFKVSQFRGKAADKVGAGQQACGNSPRRCVWRGYIGYLHISAQFAAAGDLSVVRDGRLAYYLHNFQALVWIKSWM